MSHTIERQYSQNQTETLCGGGLKSVIMWLQLLLTPRSGTQVDDQMVALNELKLLVYFYKLSTDKTRHTPIMCCQDELFGVANKT
jgi:hypothetical protein